MHPGARLEALEPPSTISLVFGSGASKLFSLKGRVTVVTVVTGVLEREGSRPAGAAYVALDLVAPECSCRGVICVTTVIRRSERGISERASAHVGRILGSRSRARRRHAALLSLCLFLFFLGERA